MPKRELLVFNLDKYRSRVQEETGFSMMVALLTLIVLISIVASVAFMTVMITQKSSQTRDYSYYSLTADAVLNEAVMLANSQTMPLPSNPSLKVSQLTQYAVSPNAVNSGTGLASANVFKGTKEESTKGITATGRTLRYFWYVTDASVTVPYSSYVLNVGVYSSDTEATSLDQVKELDSNAYFTKTRLNSTQVVGLKSIDGRVAYEVPTNELYARGLMSWDGIMVNNYARFRSYNSAVTFDPLASNATVSETAPITVKSAIVFPGNFASLQTASNGGKAGGNVTLLENTPGVLATCRLGFDASTSGPCPLPTSSFDLPIAQEDLAYYLPQAQACIAGNTPSMNWNSATDGATLPAGPSPALVGNVLCLDNLTISSDTVLNPSIQVAAQGKMANSISTGNPLHVVVKGSTDIFNGAKVNVTKSGSVGPAALRIYSNTGEFIMQSVSSTRPTTLNAIVNMGDQCSFLSPPSNATIKTVLNGAALCGSINTSGSFFYNYDTQIGQIPAVDGVQTQTYRLYYQVATSPVASLN